MFKETLFHDFEATPLIFVVEACNERDLIVSLIKYGGGRVIREKTKDALLIAGVEFTDYNSEKDAYLAIDFITTCCQRNRIVQFRHFVLKPGYKYQTSFRKDLQELESFINLQMAKSNSSDGSSDENKRTDMSRHVTSKQRKLTSAYVEPTSSDEEFLVGKKDRSERDRVPCNSQAPRKPSNSGQPYSRAEDMSIVNYIVSKEGYSLLKGNKFWKTMEDKDICSGRTWQSLKEHFKKKLLPWINNYTSDTDVIKRFRNSYSPSTWKSSTKLTPLDYNLGKANCSSVNNVPESLSEVPASRDVDMCQEESTQEDPHHTAKSKYNKKKHSNVIFIESSSDDSIRSLEDDNGVASTIKKGAHENDSQETVYIDYATKKLKLDPKSQNSQSDNSPSLLNALASREIESLKSRAEPQLHLTSFSDVGIDCKRLKKNGTQTTRKNPEENAEEFLDVEAKLQELFGEISNSTNNNLTNEYCTLENQVIRCFAKSIQPSINGPLEDFVSGLCVNCHSLTVYSKIEFTNADKSEALCSQCLESDEAELPLSFIFWVILELTGKKGSIEVTLAGNDGRDFFGCTEKEFVECASLRDLIRMKLTDFLKKKKRLHRLVGDFICNDDNSAFRNRIFLSNCVLSQCSGLQSLM